MAKLPKVSDSEALGHIRSMPLVEESAPLPEAEETSVIGDPSVFHMEIGRAKIEGTEYIEVTPELFKMLIRNQKTPALVYEGIKVYIAGTREDIERENRMNAEDYGSYIIKKKLNLL